MMSKEPIGESQEETVSIPGMEIGKTARREGGAAGGELEMDHQNILKIENTEKYFRKIRIITNSRFKPARRPSSPPQ